MKLKYRNKIEILNKNYGLFYPPYSWVSLKFVWCKCKGIFPGLVNASIFRIKLKIYDHSTSKSLSVRRRNLRAFDVEISESLTSKSQSVWRWKPRTFDVEISERSTSNAFWKLCVRTFDSDCFQIFEISELSNASKSLTKVR